MQSVMVHWRSITASSIDRMKVLQMTTLSMMRAMRSVFREVHPARLAPLPSAQVSRIDYRSSKPPQTPL
jgi:hypothetical protein